ncbi:MAG: response regulator transcription factor [Armatimonadota bacterium]
MPQKILVVEDEETIADAVAYALAQVGYETDTALDGNEGLRKAREYRPDLIILDLMLPGMSGLDLCRELRTESSVPVIMLTARHEEVDRVVGLEVGADDYVTKPFSMKELIARVKAVLRRSNGGLYGSPGGILRCGDIVMNLAEHTVTVRNRQVHLSPKEYELLKLLMMHQGRVLSRGFLLDRIWGTDTYPETRTVDVHIRWLREKIEENPAEPKHIITVRSVGYKCQG